ncbi:MAG: hypothetical protein JNK64_09490 [Myxococcales bacterium]|nr:hypothetical protein [Myxococcales bacterium]
MAIADLLEALEREAAAEVAAIDAAARAEVDAKLAAAAAAREVRRRGAVARACAARQAQLDGAEAEAARHARRAVLTARAAALARVRAACAAPVDALVARDDVLAALVAAVLASGGAEGEVRCGPALVARVRALVAPVVAVRPDAAIVGGLVASRADGRVEIDATLATLLDRLWPHLRLEVRP